MRTLESWLPEWSVVDMGEKTLPVHERYQRECAFMKEIGAKLFCLGTLPELAGTSAPGPFQSGTGGNFAMKHPDHSGRFVVTARGAHKGQLGEGDFVEITKTDWVRHTVYVRRDRKNALPSTDSLLVATAFEADPTLTAWIHFHQAVVTPHSVQLSYPALSLEDHGALALVIREGGRVINMIDHNLFFKNLPDNTPDAAIIVGSYPKETSGLATRLLSSS